MAATTLWRCQVGNAIVPLVRLSSTRSTVNSKYHLVGQPDHESNLVPIKMRKPTTDKEKLLFALQKEVWEFNHCFWKAHNQSFNTRKSEFISNELTKRGCGQSTKLTAEELSEFYRAFLDSEYKKHMQYLREWMKLNVKLTAMYFIVNLHSLFKHK